MASKAFKTISYISGNTTRPTIKYGAILLPIITNNIIIIVATGNVLRSEIRGFKKYFILSFIFEKTAKVSAKIKQIVIEDNNLKIVLNNIL